VSVTSLICKADMISWCLLDELSLPCAGEGSRFTIQLSRLDIVRSEGRAEDRAGRESKVRYWFELERSVMFVEELMFGIVVVGIVLGVVLACIGCSDEADEDDD